MSFEYHFTFKEVFGYRIADIVEMNIFRVFILVFGGNHFKHLWVGRTLSLQSLLLNFNSRTCFEFHFPLKEYFEMWNQLVFVERLFDLEFKSCPIFAKTVDSFLVHIILTNECFSKDHK